MPRSKHNVLDPDSHPAKGLTGAVRRHPSGILLLAQLLAVLAYPFSDGSTLGRAFLGAIGTCVVLIALWAVRRTPALGWVAALIGVPAVVFSILEAFQPDQDWVVLTSALLHAPFYFYVSYGMIRYLFHDDRVTRDELYATGAAFTVVAWGFAYVFVACQVVWPGSFVGAGGNEAHEFFDLLFLSFTNLTSVGLSDILPALGHARSFVMVEQVAGVLYVALVVARLVGLTVARQAGQTLGPVPAVGPQLLGQPLDDQPVGLVDGVEQVLVGDGAAEGQVVPAGPADVRHHRGVAREPVQPLVGHLAAATALDPDALGAEEGEDLAPLPRADLDHRVLVVPRVVGPGTGLGQAVGLHLR